MTIIEQRDPLWSKKSGYSKSGSWNRYSHLSKEHLVRLSPPANSFLDETFFSKEGS